MTLLRHYYSALANHSSLGRLIAVNLLTLAALTTAFVVILGTVTSLRQLFRTEVNHTVKMAAKSFMLGKSFLILESESQSLHNASLHNPEGAITGSAAILSHFDELILEASTSDNLLRQNHGIDIMRNYRHALAQLLDDDITISKDALTLESHHRLFLQKLASIEETISEMIMQEVLTGNAATGLLQINALIPFCREQILYSRSMLDQAAYDRDIAKLIAPDQNQASASLTTAITNLRQTLATMTSADPAIANEAENILAAIPPYQQTVKHLHQAINSASQLAKDTVRTRNDIIHFLSGVDQETLESLRRAEQRSTELLARTTRTIYSVTALILLVSMAGGALAHIVARQLSLSAKTAASARSALHDQIIKLEEEIAARKHAEEELRNFSESLEAIVQKRTQDLSATTEELASLITAMSHDLRTPLRGIAGFAHALREDYGDRLDHQGRAYLDRIQEACLRSGDSVDTILELSRLSRCPLSPAKIDLSDIIQSIIAELKRNDPDRQVGTVIAPSPPIQADPRLVRALLEPLVHNAWKFTSQTSKAIIQFGNRIEGDKRVFFIKDNGAGFNMAYAGKLFVPFQRLHSPDQFPGSGIGLAMAQRIVKRYQGEIWAYSRENLGTSVFFTLPGTELDNDT